MAGYTFVVTHTDLDGAASAALYLAIAGLTVNDAAVYFAEPYNLDETLREVAEHAEDGDVAAVMDLGLNRGRMRLVEEAVASLARAGVKVEWYDHHVWSPEERARITGAGAVLYVDTSTCAAGVVARYAPRERGRSPPPWAEDLVRATCSADLWRWDHPLSPKLFRVMGRSDEESWRLKVVDKLSRGILWDEELEARLEEYVNAELEGYGRVLATLYTLESRGCRVAAVYKKEGPPSNSMIGSTLLSRLDADIAVIARTNGAISLRSRRVNVQKVAAALGGGGHPAAAGAKVPVPLHVRLLRLITPRAYTRYIARLVLRKALEAGVCGG